MKKYIAKTKISINIVLSTGISRHITFSALTGGGSVYYTSDPDIIQALEHHHRYGMLFHDVNEPQSETENSADNKADSKIDYSESDEAGEGVEENAGLKTIVVSDPDAAKAYLAEHFGISRTKIKTVKAIKEVAEANGIVFEGI
jgi:hypothetical protein